MESRFKSGAHSITGTMIDDTHTYAHVTVTVVMDGQTTTFDVPKVVHFEVGNDDPDEGPEEPSPEAIQRLVDSAPDLNPTAVALLAKVCRQLEHALRAEGEDELRAWLRTMYRTALQSDDVIDAKTGLPRAWDEVHPSSAAPL